MENLQNLLFSRIRDPNPKDEKRMQGGQLSRAETFGVIDGNPPANAMNSKRSVLRHFSSCLRTIFIVVPLNHIQQ